MKLNLRFLKCEEHKMSYTKHRHTIEQQIDT